MIAAGEEVVFTNGGKWVAALAAPPPMPPTPEEEADRQARIREAMQALVRMQIEDGRVLPDGHPLVKLLDEGA